MSRNQETLSSKKFEKGKGTLALAGILLAGAALSGCTTSEAPEPRPTSSTEYETPSLESELAQKLEQNRLNPEDLKIVVAEYENTEAAANAWWDTFTANCIEYGNPRLSYENNIKFIAQTGELDANVFDKFKLAENHEVCRSAMMADTQEAKDFMNVIGNLNAVFIANQLLDNSPKFTLGDLAIEFSSESEVIGTVPFTFSREQQGAEESVSDNYGFKFTTSDEGTLVWNKRP